MIVPMALQQVMGVARFVSHGPRHFSRRLPTKIRILSVFEMTIVFRFVVENVHVAALVEPQTSDDDVVHGSRYFPPRVMIAAAFKSHVSDALCVRAWMLTYIERERGIEKQAISAVHMHVMLHV